jgi:pimeloyl-ACP methyl ester carboxylesterase
MSFELATQLVRASEAATAVVVILHGALGSAQNFRSFASRLSRVRPDYGVLLADLRHHGRSRPAPPPNTLSACANDVERLVHRVNAEGRGAVRAVIGHSLGGKVALEVARQMEGALEQVWVLDSNPGPQPIEMDSEIRRVIQALERVQMPLERRADIVPLLRRDGLSTGIANWMTTNLERTEQGDYRWAFDLDRIKELLADYAATDLWPYLHARVQNQLDLHVVVAERSERLDAPLRERLSRLENERRLRYHLLEKAGHWLHVDNPEGLLALLAEGLPR